MRVSPVWLVLGSILSVQIGASFAKSMFGQVEPVAMTWLRAASSAVMLVAFRPRFTGLARRDVAQGASFAVCLVVMNWAIYESFARIPVGLAVTIEFIGPLAVSLTSSRRWSDLVWVALAATGVVLLGVGPVRLDPVGIALAALGGACWAGYIVIGSRLGGAWHRPSLLFATYAVAAVVLAAPALTSSGAGLLDARVLGVGAAVGLLSSVAPYLLELRAMRDIPRGVFGVLMSLEPAAAASAALVVLGETLDARQWAAILCVVASAIGATRSASSGWRRRPAAG